MYVAIFVKQYQKQHSHTYTQGEIKSLTFMYVFRAERKVRDHPQNLATVTSGREDEVLEEGKEGEIVRLPLHNAVLCPSFCV